MCASDGKYDRPGPLSREEVEAEVERIAHLPQYRSDGGAKLFRVMCWVFSPGDEQEWAKEKLRQILNSEGGC